MDRALVVVRGIGDVGSAVAHRLFSAGFGVVVHDIAAPSAPRRGMAFTDAMFEGAAELDGVKAVRAGALDDLPGDGSAVLVTSLGLDGLLGKTAPVALVDARMRKHAVPEAQRGLAPMVIGLGPGFVAGETCDLAIETSWGERLGTIVTQGPTAELAGEPRTYGGHARDRFVYAPARGLFQTSASIAQAVVAGEVVASLDGAPLAAPLDGILRGLTHDGAVIEPGTKCIEVDPRAEVRHVTGIGERPGAIGDAVVRAIREHGR